MLRSEWLECVEDSSMGVEIMSLKFWRKCIHKDLTPSYQQQLLYFGMLFIDSFICSIMYGILDAESLQSFRVKENILINLAPSFILGLCTGVLSVWISKRLPESPIEHDDL